MRIIFLLGALATALFAAVVVLNAQTMAEPSAMNIGYTTVRGAPGVIAASLAAVAIVAFALCLGVQALLFNRTRRAHTKALETQRSLAEEAEASRFNQLRLTMVSEFEKLAIALSASQDALRAEIQDSGNSIAAMLAEIDDRTRTNPPTGNQAR